MYEVIAMVKQLGVPTWFMTLSCADLDGLSYFRLLLELNGKNMTAEEVEALLYDKRNYCQVADSSTCQRIKSSRNVGELVFNPVQLIRS